MQLFVGYPQYASARSESVLIEIGCGKAKRPCHKQIFCVLKIQRSMPETWLKQLVRKLFADLHQSLLYQLAFPIDQMARAYSLTCMMANNAGWTGGLSRYPLSLREALSGLVPSELMAELNQESAWSTHQGCTKFARAYKDQKQTLTGIAKGERR